MVDIEQSEYRFGSDNAGQNGNIKIRLIKNAVTNPGVLRLTSFSVVAGNFSSDKSN